MHVGLVAESYLHPGEARGRGRGDAAPEREIQREAETSWPTVAAQTLRGALQSALRSYFADDADALKILGLQGNTKSPKRKVPNWEISNAHLLALPMRSLSSSAIWVTTAELLRRAVKVFSEEHQTPIALDAIPEPHRGEAFCSHETVVFVEELSFAIRHKPPEPVCDFLSKFVVFPAMRERIQTDFAVVHADDFSWLAQCGLPLKARTRLTADKCLERVWYQETIPPDAVFWSSIDAPSEPQSELLEQFFDAHPYLCAGASRTQGLGWLTAHRIT